MSNINVNDTLNQRGSRYGTFEANAATTQELYTTLLRSSKSALTPLHLEALHMICHKLSRIVCGDPNYDDSWVDIAGYATLVAEHLQRKAGADYMKAQKANAFNAGM